MVLRRGSPWHHQRGRGSKEFARRIDESHHPRLRVHRWQRGGGFVPGKDRNGCLFCQRAGLSPPYVALHLSLSVDLFFIVASSPFILPSITGLRNSSCEIMHSLLFLSTFSTHLRKYLINHWSASLQCDSWGSQVMSNPECLDSSSVGSNEAPINSNIPAW